MYPKRFINIIKFKEFSHLPVLKPVYKYIIIELINRGINDNINTLRILISVLFFTQ